MKTPLLDLLIVGAGPVGAATAVAAVDRGAKRVLIVDQARSLRPSGRGLDILPNGVNALRALSPAVHDLIQPFIRPKPSGKPRAVYKSAKGTDLSRMTPDYGDSATLRWWQLQQTLLSALPEGNFLVLNHQLVDIVHESDTGFACAEFIQDRQRKNEFKNWEDDNNDQHQGPDSALNEAISMYFEGVTMGSEDSKERNETIGRRVKCRAKVVVGADGINSVARRCIYRDCFPHGERYAAPEYSGYVRVAARGFPEVSAKDESKIRQMYLGDAMVASVTCEPEKITPFSIRSFVIHIPPGDKISFTWSMFYYFALDEQKANTSSPKVLTDITASVAREADFLEEMVQVSHQIWEATPEEQILIRKFYTVPATHPAPFGKIPTSPNKEYPQNFYRPWYHRRVVLAGDSAHAAPNPLGQGTAMGIEDALELAVRLANSGLWSGDDSKCPDEKALEKVFADYRSG